MVNYTPPLRDIQFVLHELLEVEKHYATMPPHAEVSADLVDQIIEEGGKFCAEVKRQCVAASDRSAPR